MNDGTQQENAGAPIRVFLLDDHELVRRGVRDLLDDEPGITVVGEAGTAALGSFRTSLLTTRAPVRAAAPTKEPSNGRTRPRC